MSSILTKLNDEDLDAVRHMIRKDALSDLEIWKEAEKRLGTKAQSSKAAKLPKTEAAQVMVINRYRKSGEYKRWLKAWESRDLDLKKAIALQKQRFELLSNLVKDPSADGMETLSKSLQARLLTLAAESSDEELVEGAAKNGWIKNVIRVIQEQAKIEKRTAGEKAVEVCRDKDLSEEDRERRMKEIFGMA